MRHFLRLLLDLLNHTRCGRSSAKICSEIGKESCMMRSPLRRSGSVNALPVLPMLISANIHGCSWASLRKEESVEREYRSSTIMA